MQSSTDRPMGRKPQNYLGNVAADTASKYQKHGNYAKRE